MRKNKNHIIILLSFLLISTFSFSQKAKIDSLKIELQKHTKKDTLRVNILNNIASSIYKKNFNEAINYLDESETISRIIDYKKGLARSLFLRGLSTIIKTNYKTGDKYYGEALLIYKKLKIKKSIALIYFNQGVFYSRNRDYISSIDYYKKAIKIKEKIGNKNTYFDIVYLARAYSLTGSFKEAILNFKKALDLSEKTSNSERIEDCLWSIGNIYNHQGNYHLALEYINESLVSAKKNGHKKNISDALVAIGNVYIRLQKYDKAIEFHNKALTQTKEIGGRNIGTVLHNLGESYKYKREYGKALNLFEKSIVEFKKLNNEANIAITLNKIGEIYLTQKKDKKALEYFQKAKQTNLNVNNLRGLCGSYFGLAKIYYNKRQFNQSLNIALKGKKKSKKMALLDIQRDIEELLSKIYEATGNYKKALESHKQYKILSDSLINKKNIEKIAQIEAEYKYKKVIDSAKIRELQLTKRFTKTNQDLEKSQQNLLLGVIAFLIIALMMGAIIFFLKLRNEKSKTQNIIIEQKLLRSQMTPHFIFNSLSVLQGMILNKEESKSVSYLSKFSKLLRTILENSRHKTVMLSEELSAIESYMSLQNLDVTPPYNFNLTVASNIDKSAFKIPPMLIQPFIENTIEHAFPNIKENKEISIDLSFKNKELVCIIKDNGIGVNLEKQKRTLDKKTLAIAITSERLKILSKDFKTQGSVKVENRKVNNEQETLVTLIIPYKN